MSKKKKIQEREGKIMPEKKKKKKKKKKLDIVVTEVINNKLENSED